MGVYGHFLLEVLPKLLLARELWRLGFRVRVAFPTDAPPVSAIVEQFLDDDQLITYEWKSERLRAPLAIFPSLSGWPKQHGWIVSAVWRLAAALSLRPYTREYLRKAALSLTAARSGLPAPYSRKRGRSVLDCSSVRVRTRTSARTWLGGPNSHVLPREPRHWHGVQRSPWRDVLPTGNECYRTRSSLRPSIGDSSLLWPPCRLCDVERGNLSPHMRSAESSRRSRSTPRAESPP